MGAVGGGEGPVVVFGEAGEAGEWWRGRMWIVEMGVLGDGLGWVWCWGVDAGSSGEQSDAESMELV